MTFRRKVPVCPACSPKCRSCRHVSHLDSPKLCSSHSCSCKRVFSSSLHYTYTHSPLHHTPTHPPAPHTHPPPPHTPTPHPPPHTHTPPSPTHTHTHLP